MPSYRRDVFLAVLLSNSKVFGQTPVGTKRRSKRKWLKKQAGCFGVSLYVRQRTESHEKQSEFFLQTHISSCSA
jgi:hypothetical protein